MAKKWNTALKEAMRNSEQRGQEEIDYPTTEAGWTRLMTFCTKKRDGKSGNVKAGYAIYSQASHGRS